MTRVQNVVRRLRDLFGVDQAIALTLSARIWTIGANIVTVILMLHFLTPVEQGYYFTLLSLVALQVVFELGFSFVIQQMAAHERAHLEIDADGKFIGNRNSHARLASILQLTCRWYLRAAIVLAAVLLPLGIYFFSHNEASGRHIDWFMPWAISVAACAYLFVLTPFFAFLEGCGDICQVARMRLGQVVANAFMAWAAMISHRGLYAPSLVMLASGVVGTIFLWTRRKFLLSLLRHPAGDSRVSWRHEIWPFQWKIAVSWLCTYFTMQVFTPMLFHYRGAVEAGQMGMSISITGYVYAIVLAWMTTKAPPFGKLVAQRNFARLDQLFFATLRQAVLFLFLMIAASMATMLLLQEMSPRLAARLVPPAVFGFLLAGTVGSILVQSMAIYLRSFKREPFLIQSLVVALLTLLSALVLVRRLGSMGISLSYFVCTGVVGLIYAYVVFHSWRQRHASLAKTEVVFVSAGS